MDAPTATPIKNSISVRQALLLVPVATIAFHLAYSFAACSFLIAVYLWCLFQLTLVQTSRQASYFGFAVGLLTFAPQMNFLWTIFGPAAIALWLVLAFWIRMFIFLGRICRQKFGEGFGILLLPFLWTGLEYFRSELYFLRFSWLNIGYAFSSKVAWLPLNYIGMYGVGFVFMAIICAASRLPRKSRALLNATALVALGILTNLPAPSAITSSSEDLQIAGMQMEFPSEPEVLLGLDKLIKTYPDAQLLVLSEYTFQGPVPEVKTWCKTHQRYLIVGGEASAPNDYYNTAFVVDPSGAIVFSQAKCVPIQFFKDGLPAKGQKLWKSPWGNIGLCVCYDLSYTRVTDELIRLGAQALFVPTMDVVDWGRHQHELHARVAPVRSAEYGLPIFRLASSGISQCVNSTGQVLAAAPMPGDEAMLSGRLHFARTGVLPWDRMIAPLSVGITGVTAGWLLFSCLRSNKSPLPKLNRL